MKELLDGLLLYEITLLILGVILFLILSIGLLYYIIKKEQIAKLLFFFFIPIVMIGYPSITQITISNDKIELTKLQNQVIDNPDDSVAVQKMEELTEKLEKRASTPKDLVQLSTSNLVLGNNEKAETLADKALTQESGNEEARDIKRLIVAEERLKAAAAESVREREETRLSATTPAPAATIAESPVVEAVPETRESTQDSLLKAQTKALQDVRVTTDLTRVKTYLMQRSLNKVTTSSDSNN
jgi:hypothetical protein